MDTIKKYWGAFLFGFIFLIVGILTILGIAYWTSHTSHELLVTLLAGFAGIIIGIVEVVEGIRLLRIPFKK